VLQRSTHESPVDVPAIPATVQPGESVDWPAPIAGFEPVPDQAPPPSPEPVPSNRKKAASPAASGEEPTQ
jgi:hypothetical protein